LSDIDIQHLEILYQDSGLVAINKPHGLLVHKSAIAADTSLFAVQLLRDQLGMKVYPVHRLDRKTSGVLLFSLNENLNTLMQQQFMNGVVGKRYHAIVRGFSPDEMDIDYPLKRDDGVMQDAFTSFKTVQKTEMPFATGKHETSRYSFVELIPTTGRMHQLRKHMAHVFHPIIGDRPHGCNKQNKFFKENLNMNTMLLHATELSFLHPLSNTPVVIKADFQPEFKRMISTLGFQFISC